MVRPGKSRQPRMCCPSSATILPNNCLALMPLARVRRQVNDSRPVMPRLRRKSMLAASHTFFRKPCGICIHRMPAPSPVLTSQPHAAAVVEIQEDRQPLLDDFVGLLAFDVDDKSYATGVDARTAGRKDPVWMAVRSFSCRCFSSADYPIASFGLLTASTR